MGLIVVGLYGLISLNLTAPEAEPIVELLRGIPSALRFALDHPLHHVKVCGVTSATLCAIVTALVFGKEEDSGFRFSQEMIDDTVVIFKDMLSGGLVPFFPELQPYWFRPIVHLCVSDTNKAMLVQSGSSGLIALLLDALFLEADHVRKDASMKAPIQTNAADCFLQIAVFEPGRELLLNNPAVMGALHALADGSAMTEEGQLSAARALVAIEGVIRGLAPDIHIEGGEDSVKHIMISYQWVS